MLWLKTDKVFKPISSKTSTIANKRLNRSARLSKLNKQISSISKRSAS